MKARRRKTRRELYRGDLPRPPRRLNSTRPTQLCYNKTIMFKPSGPCCQSCGMPLSKDEGHGGTEQGGRKSTDYCSHCYQNGAFTEPNLTVQQMQEKVKGKQKLMHIPAFLPAYFPRATPPPNPGQ